MKNLLLLFFFIFSCAQQSKKLKDHEVDLYCQDLNVLYQRIEVISSNIANAKTTRTLNGDTYKRKIIKSCKNGLCKVIEDNRKPILKYEPKHPDPNTKGYVAYPNINLEEEKYEQIKWSRVFEELVRKYTAPNTFFFQDKRSQKCIERYPTLKEKFNYSEYLGRDLFK